jgi:5-methylcytosine-specific restriction endonuclease McrA
MSIQCAGWVRHVRENTRNRVIVGEAGDLEAFMFGHQRANLEPVREVLLEAQAGNCFYCGRGIREQGAVDHFIPWSRYPRDLAHNFVLAHATCNGSKSDLLASRRHLEHWREATDGRAGEELGRALAAKGVIANAECSHTVARWAYAQGLAIGAQA